MSVFRLVGRYVLILETRHKVPKLPPSLTQIVFQAILMLKVQGVAVIL